MKIYDRTNAWIRYSDVVSDVPITKDCQHVEELMKSNYVALSWRDSEKYALLVGSYIIPYPDETYGIDQRYPLKYRLFEKYDPEGKSEAEYEYTPQFQHPIMWLSRIPFFFVTGQIDSWQEALKKTTWSYTGIPRDVAWYVIKAINWLADHYPMFNETIGGGWDYAIVGDLPATGNVSIDGLDIWSGASAIANAFDCEFHFDFKNRIFYLGTISLGEEVELKAGYNVSVASVNRTKDTYHNAFLVKGSTRNLSQPTNTGELAQVRERLGLDTTKYPDGVMYTDEDGTIISREAFLRKKVPMMMEELIFDNIYPKLELYIYGCRERLCWLLDSDGNKVEDEDHGYYDPDTGKRYKYYSKWYLRLSSPTYGEHGEVLQWDDYIITDPETQIVDGRELGITFLANQFDHAVPSNLIGFGEFTAACYNEERPATEHGDDDIDPTPWQPQYGEYRIDFKEENGVIIPTTSTGGLYPMVYNNASPSLRNNKVTLINVVVDDVYKKRAQNDLEIEGRRKVAMELLDLNNYILQSNPVYFEQNNPQLEIGQKVVYDDGRDLVGEESYRLETHIIKIETSLDYPFVQEITVGNEKVKGDMQSMRDELSQITSGGFGGMTEDQFTGMLEEYGDGLFLSKTHEDETKFLISFFAGLIADKLIESPDWIKGAWSMDEETGEETNDGRGFSIYNDGLSSWNIELDYATVRHLMRAKELYTQQAHIGTVTNQTIFRIGLQTLGNILLGHYHEGVEGGIITPEGHAELSTLITRGLAQLQELFVVNDSTFGGNLSSIDFISGFLTGKGWAIQKKYRTNPAGVQEEYYAMEIDNLTVRNILRVYEFVVSQMRGENDNYMFAAFLEVHHYDPVTGKVWLSTEQGKFYNPFREDDCIVVQQYQGENDVTSGGDGYITKHYELVITEAGIGGETDVDENGDRLDWVRFKNFTTDMEGVGPISLIKKGDTFVRKDNLSDPERKGVMSITTVGPNTPYMDVAYGLVTNPNDALKARFGKLEGIRTELFGWLEGFGAYINNLYGVGTIMNCQTGENVQSRFEVTSNNLRSVYRETTYAVETNFVANGDFQDGLDKWTLDDPYGSGNPSSEEQKILGDGDGDMLINGEQLATQYTSKSELTEYAGIRVLRLTGSGISQSWTDMEANGTHDEVKNDEVGTPNYDAESESYYDGQGLTPAQIQARIAAAKAANAAIEAAAEDTKTVPDKLYMGVRMLPLTSGRLKVYLVAPNGTRQTLFEQNVNSSVSFGLFQAMDSEANPWTWNTTQNGSLRIEYTGECLLRFIAISNDPISDIEAEYSTRFLQNSRRIELQAMKETADHRQAFAQITIKYNEISSVVSNNKQVTDVALQTLTGGLDAEIAARKAADRTMNDTFATYQRQTDSAIQTIAGHWDADGHLIGYSTTEQTSSMINSGVATANSNAQQYVANLKALINTDVLLDSGNAYATWKTQTSSTVATLAGKWDSSGNLIGYSTTEQTWNKISTEVAAEATRINGVLTTSYSTTQQTKDLISSTVTKSYIQGKVDDVYANKSELPNMSLYYDKSTIDQKANEINLNVSRVEQEIVSISDVSMWEDGSVNRSASAGTEYANMKQADSHAIRYKNLVAVNMNTSFLINSGYNMLFAYFNSSKKLTRVASSTVSPNTYGIVKPSATSSEPYVAAIIYHAQGGSMDPANVPSTGIGVTKDNVVTQAYLNLFVDKDSVSWLQGSADNVIFNFSSVFQIHHNNKAVMQLDANGDLKITGTLIQNAEIGTVLPISVGSDGSLMRKSIDNTIEPLYAGRYVKYKVYTVNGANFSMLAGHDFFLSIGNYNPKYVDLPPDPSNGKIITIKNVGGKTVVRPKSTTSHPNIDIRMNDTSTDHFDLNNYDRVEFVFYGSTWWGNVMSI